MSSVKSGRSRAFRIGDLLVGHRYVYVIVSHGMTQYAALGFETLDGGTQTWVNNDAVEARLFPSERVVR